MTKKLICGIYLALCAMYVMYFVTPAYASHTNSPKAQQIICGDSVMLIDGLEKRYGEKVVEQGVDNDEHVLVVITASLKRTWSFLATPKGKPKVYCVIVTGTDWLQEQGSSKGIAYDGSVVNIIFDNQGKWQMLVLNTTTGSITKVTTGHGWERLIDLNNWLQ